MEEGLGDRWGEVGKLGDRWGDDVAEEEAALVVWVAARKEVLLRFR